MSFLRKLGSILLDIVIVLLVLLIIMNIFFITDVTNDRIPSLFGYKFMVDLTDSMEPAIDAGDLIIIKVEKEYNKNDIVSYRNSNHEIITHRIVEKTKNGYYLKGDNNSKLDEGVVNNKNIEGRLVMTVHKLGLFCLFLQSIYGIIFLIVIVICYVVFLIIKEKYF